MWGRRVCGGSRLSATTTTVAGRATRGNGTSTSYTYDPASRLASLAHAFPIDTARNITLGFGYNPAGQIVSNSRSNDLFAWTGHGAGSLGYTANGLNQVTDRSGTAVTHDAKGNMTADGRDRVFGYSSENLLTGITKPSTGAVTTLTYDPLLRFAGATTGTRGVAYDGHDIIATYSGTGSLTSRYVHAPGATDEPLVQVLPSGQRYWFHADERGSVIAGTAASGQVYAINTSDEYGRPGPAGNAWLFQYTGAPVVAGGLTYLKSRMYDVESGNLLQPDRIGYGDGMHLYAYAGRDPVNFVDPSGLAKKGILPTPSTTPRVDGAGGDLVVTGPPYCARNPLSSSCGGTLLRIELNNDLAGLRTPIANRVQEAVPQNVQVSVPTYEDANGDIVVTATRTISVHQKWVLAGGGYHLNPYYVDPYPWLNLENFLSVQIGAFATAGAVAGAPALAGRMATSRTFGVSSSRFGNNFYRGGAGQGSWNHGSARLGWSFNARTGNVYFQGRVGNYHIPTPIFTPAP